MIALSPYSAASFGISLLLAIVLCISGAPSGAETSPFLIKPYLQFGNEPNIDAESLSLLWQAEDIEASWEVESQLDSGQPWRKTAEPQYTRLSLPGLKSQRLYTTVFKMLDPGRPFNYRVLKNNQLVFAGSGTARKSATQPYRFAVLGDIAAGTTAQKQVAYQLYKMHPDLAVVTGDIVYQYGLLSDYLQRFFPVYNADSASPATGAPLIRSIPFIAAVGNHDLGFVNKTDMSNLDRFPDGYAYFYLWSQPLNGPPVALGDPNTPKLRGSPASQAVFLNAAGPSYPRMANFSFDYGNSHWVVLDANDHMDWSNPAFRAWVDSDLQSARRATWRFVAFHQPGFSSGRAHFFEQRMRLLADIFQDRGVDIVFSGHVHNYQRTFPLLFTPEKQTDGKWLGKLGDVTGRLSLNKSFDGKVHMDPEGVIYVITGAGGAPLHGWLEASIPSCWQSYTEKFVAHKHSFTICDVDNNKLSVRQISDDGQELDAFTITKAPIETPAVTGSAPIYQRLLSR